MTRSRRDALLIVITGFVVAAGVAGGVIAFSPDNTSPSSSPTDSGVTACQMMHEDKVSGSTPDNARSADEIRLLQASATADLKAAGDALATGDVEAGMGAVDKLYLGCATLGRPI